MKSIFLFILVASVIFPACKKKKTDPCVISVATLAGTYKLTSLRFKPSGGTESEIIGSLPACKQDDLTILNANGKMNYQDAGVVCTPNGSFPGDWTLTGNMIDIEGRAGTIQGFDCTTLIFYTNDFPSPGDRTTYRYMKQ